MSSTTGVAAAPPGIAMKSGLWAAQTLVGLPFIAVGLTKLLMPIPKLAAIIPWAGQLSEPFVRSIGLIDITGGVGMLLPALTRIKPGLTVWAALGCTVLQVFAIVFHASRGEITYTPGNFVFLGLSIFVLWGRSRKAPIPPRA